MTPDSVDFSIFCFVHHDNCRLYVTNCKACSAEEVFQSV